MKHAWVAVIAALLLLAGAPRARAAEPEEADAAEHRQEGAPPPPKLEDDTGIRAWERPKLGVLGFSGALTIVGGVGTIAAGGLVMGLSAPVNYKRASPKRDGAAIIGVGATMAALGLTAVLVDVLVLQRRQRQRRVQVSLDLSRSRAGLAVAGRF